MFYFGYGSNMSAISLRAKGVEPTESVPAMLSGWRLVFNIPDFFSIEGCTGNIERAPNDEVHGVLHECDDEQLAVLDRLEALGVSYARTTLAVTTYDGRAIDAQVYVGLPQRLSREGKPSNRYRRILLTGAEAAKLRPDYVTRIRKIQVQPTPRRPPFRFPELPNDIFDSKSLAAHAAHTALAGAVFDMTHARDEHDFLKRFLAGRDVSVFFLKRMDSSDGRETSSLIEEGDLNDAQWRHLNNYLHEFAREYRFVGRMDYATRWRSLESRSPPGEIAPGPTAVAPSDRVLRRAERTNDELRHENLGFLSRSHGFMPKQYPRERMPESFAAWDEVATRLPELYRTLKLRSTLDRLPLLVANEEHLPDGYLLRAAALLSMLAHAYYYVEPKPPEGLPVALTTPWAQVRERLGRGHAVLTYMDLIVYNWRLLDRQAHDPMTIDNMRLLIPTVDNKEERIFYLTQTEILSRAGPIVSGVADAQTAVVQDDPAGVRAALESIIECIERLVRESLLNINPNPNSAHYVDPVIWAKTVAPFAVPFEQGVQGPSGTSSPIFNLMDVFLGRKKHDTFLGKEIKELRSGYPRFWREFLEAAGEVSVPDYIETVDDSQLRGLLKEAREVYSGDNGFLGRHRMKVYGYLELAFKVGRNVTIGGFSGLFQDRTWDQVDSELEYSRLERLESFPRGCHFGRIVRAEPTFAGAADGTQRVVLDVADAGVRYEPGDRIGILPENSTDLVTKTLSALSATGDEVISLTREWADHVHLRWGFAEANALSLSELLRFAKLRPVTPRIAEALHALSQDDELAEANIKGEVDRWEVWDLLVMLRSKGFDPKRLWKAPIDDSAHICRVLPPETFRMYSISSAMEAGESTAKSLELTVGRVRYTDAATEYSQEAQRKGTASHFLTSSAGRSDPVSFILVHPPRFGLPKDPEVPVVMLCGGTGFSPFRGFILERLRSHPESTAWLFFATRSREYFYYHPEIAEAAASGRLRVHTAFSREAVRTELVLNDSGTARFDFVDAQPRNLEEMLKQPGVAAELRTLLLSKDEGGQGAHFYICGRSRFAKAVVDAFVDVLAQDREGSPEARRAMALDVTAKMAAENRLQQEIFTDARSWQREKERIPVSEIIKHNDDETGFWIVVDDAVYDISEFIRLHPGGSTVLRGYAGTDATQGYLRAHARQSEVDANREMYEVGSVLRPDFDGVSLEAEVGGMPRRVTLASLYRRWCDAAYLVVEMENALINDQSLQHGNTNRTDPEHERTPYKLQRAIETHERFLANYLEGLAESDTLTDLWRTCAAISQHVEGDLSVHLEAARNSLSARFVEASGACMDAELLRWVQASRGIPIRNDRTAAAHKALGVLRELTGELLPSRGVTLDTRGGVDRLVVDAELQELTAQLEQHVDRLLDTTDDAEHTSIHRLVQGVRLLEAESRAFLRELKVLLREGLMIFERYASEVIESGGAELAGVLNQLPSVFAGYFERCHRALEQQGWQPELEKRDRAAQEQARSQCSVVFSSSYWVVEIHDANEVVLLRRSPAGLESLDDLVVQNERVLRELDEVDLHGIVVDMRQAPPRNDPEFEKAMGKLRGGIFERFERVAVLLSSAVGVLQVNRLARDEGVNTFATLSESAAIRFARPPT